MSFWSKVGDWWNNVTGQTAAMQKQQEFNRQEAEKQRAFEQQQAQIQRDYEERLSNTAIQRQVADAKAAGVNSAMLFSNGSTGASTPVGSAAKGSAASSSIGNPGPARVAGLMNSAANLVRSFNYDRNRSNDVSLGKAVKTIAKITSILK